MQLKRKIKFKNSYILLTVLWLQKMLSAGTTIRMANYQKDRIQRELVRTRRH